MNVHLTLKKRFELRHSSKIASFRCQLTVLHESYMYLTVKAAKSYQTTPTCQRLKYSLSARLTYVWKQENNKNLYSEQVKTLRSLLTACGCYNVCQPVWAVRYHCTPAWNAFVYCNLKVTDFSKLLTVSHSGWMLYTEVFLHSGWRIFTRVWQRFAGMPATTRKA